MPAKLYLKRRKTHKDRYIIEKNSKRCEIKKKRTWYFSHFFSCKSLKMTLFTHSYTQLTFNLYIFNTHILRLLCTLCYFFIILIWYKIQLLFFPSDIKYNAATKRCLNGYTGSYCRQKCPYPHYGARCQRRCQCSRHICSHINGCAHQSKNMFR